LVKHVGLILLTFLALLAARVFAQTIFPEWEWFKLYAVPDGRVVANLKGSGYRGENDPYTQVFRNFIEMDHKTGDLVVVFGVAEENLRIQAHLVSVTIQNGEVMTSEPYVASAQRDGWFQDNMILWYDKAQEALVMIYQEGCMSCWAAFEEDWLLDLDLDAMNQTLWKSVTYDGGQTWTERIQILSDVWQPHVHYQMIPGLDLDEDGHAKQLMIPVHHLDENVTEYNYQMLWRCNREIDPEDGSWTVTNLTNSSETSVFGGFIQASIVRPVEDEPKLVAFLRDRAGMWMHRTESLDDGRHWANPEEMPIPNADLMSQAIQLRSGMTVLIYNPQQSYPTGVDTGDRLDNTHTMMVALSDDAGLTWKYSRILEYHYDGLHAYPVGFQDPGCNNIYLTYSVGAHETVFMSAPNVKPFVPGCEAWAIQGNMEQFEDCLQRTMPHNYIKFTIFNEGWIKREPNWSLDYEDCLYKIPDAVRADLATIKAAADGHTVEAEQDKTVHYWKIAIILAITLAVFLMFDFVVCCVQKQIRPQVGIDHDRPHTGANDLFMSSVKADFPTDSMLNTAKGDPGFFSLPRWKWGSNRKSNRSMMTDRSTVQSRDENERRNESEIR